MAKNKIILILLLILALAIRYIKADQSFWLDEAAQAVLSSQSVVDIWSQRAGDFHPPLFYILAHFWLGVGRSEIWLRTLPIILGVATVYLVYVFAKQFYNEKVAFLAAFFLAINPFHVYYSQEFRMYSLLSLLGLWSMYWFWKKSRGLFVVNTLLLYTHYSSGYVFLTQVVYLFLFDRKSLGYYLGQVTLSLILFAPWLGEFAKQLQNGVGADTYLPGWRELLTIPTLKALPTIIFKFVAGRINLFPKWIYALYIVVVMGVTAVATLLAKQRRMWVWVWLGVPIVASTIVSFWVPQTQPFRLIFVLPAVVLVLAEAASRFPRLFVSFTLYFAVVGLMLTFTRPRLLREQWREATAFLISQQSKVVVKFPGSFAPLQWYGPDLPVIGAIPQFPAQPKAVASVLVDSLQAQDDQIMVLDYLQDITDPQSVVATTLNNLSYVETQGFDFPGVGIVRKFERR